MSSSEDRALVSYFMHRDGVTAGPPMPDRAMVESAARRHASISELEAAIRLLRYSAKQGGLPLPLTERLLAALWELEEVCREGKGQDDA